MSRRYEEDPSILRSQLEDLQEECCEYKAKIAALEKEIERLRVELKYAERLTMRFLSI
jgi:uncharacterized small protein (DUF1192 family)